ncbi:hypothetical protein Droror1_Dr00028273 [Drosera rotundifolia]
MRGYPWSLRPSSSNFSSKVVWWVSFEFDSRFSEFGAAAVKDCVRDVWFAATGILAWWLWRLVCKQLCRVSSYVFTPWFDWWLFVVEMVKAALIVVVGVPVNAMFSWK